MKLIMKLIDPNSLAATLDAVNEAAFYGRPLSNFQREEIARWIAGRQGLPGSYAGMFAPTEHDFREGVRLFTGETVTTRAGTAHILGEEACRALILLNVPIAEVNDALNRATHGIMNRLAEHECSGHKPGTYCCGKCSCALWRHLTVGGLGDSERWLNAGVEALRLHHDGKGKWRVFPFYYALLALSEVDLPSATEEMRYAAPACERRLKRAPQDDQFAQRRRVLLERILEKC